MRSTIIVPLLFFIAILGCEEDPDIEPEVFNPPFTNFIFINGSQLSQVDSLIDLNDSLQNILDSTITVTSNQISTLQDSLQTVEDSIAVGGDLEELANKIQEQIDEDQNTLDSLNMENTAVTTELSDAESERTIINSGLLFIDRIRNTENNEILTFADSMSDYSLPLSLDPTNIQYEITIAGNANTVDLTYDVQTVQNIEREIRFTASNLEVPTHTFDSLAVECDADECTSNEITIRCYF